MQNVIFFNVYIFYNSFEVLYMGHTLTNITKHSCHYCDHQVASIYQIILVYFNKKIKK